MFLPLLPLQAGFWGWGGWTVFWKILKLREKVCYFVVENSLYPAKELPYYVMSLRNDRD
jgi:hypothetical protein